MIILIVWISVFFILSILYLIPFFCKYNRLKRKGEFSSLYNQKQYRKEGLKFLNVIAGIWSLLFIGSFVLDFILCDSVVESRVLYENRIDNIKEKDLLIISGGIVKAYVETERGYAIREFNEKDCFFKYEENAVPKVITYADFKTQYKGFLINKKVNKEKYDSRKYSFILPKNNIKTKEK